MATEKRDEVDEVFPDPDGLGDEEEGAQPTTKDYICRYCPAGPFSSTQKRRRHEQREHKNEASQATAKGRMEQATGGVPATTLSEKAKEFAESVAASAPDMKAATKKQMIEAFENESDVLVRNATELENFLDDYGLTLHQIRQVVRRIIGRRSTTSGFSDGNQMVQAYNPATGQPMSVIIMGQGNPQTPASPPIIIASPGGGEKDSTPPALTRDDVEDIVERMVSKIAEANQPPPGPAPNMRSFQEPILHPESGQPMVDAKGQIMMRYVQEPIDPLTSTLGIFKELGIFDKEAPPPVITAEEVASKVAETVGANQPQGPSPEILELTRKFDDFKAGADKDDAVRGAIRDTTTDLMRQYQPLLDDLRDKESKSGLTDFQAELSNNRDQTRDMLNTLNNFQSGVREDFQPMVKQMAATNLKAQGFSEQAIADILASPTAPAPEGSRVDIGRASARDTMKQWVKEA